MSSTLTRVFLSATDPFSWWGCRFVVSNQQPGRRQEGLQDTNDISAIAPRQVTMCATHSAALDAPIEMALNATIYKVDLQVSDTDRHYYSSHALTVARHPSETSERMMARLIAFVLHADENLAFTKGLSQTDEPDIWLKDLTGAIDLWIEVGQPTETRLLKACGRASQVLVYCFNGHASQLWWNAIQQKTARASNLKIVSLPSDAIRSLASKTERSMALQTTIQDGELFITLDNLSLSLRPEAWRDFRS